MQPVLHQHSLQQSTDGVMINNSWDCPVIVDDTTKHTHK
jgi:hypothetical protein